MPPRDGNSKLDSNAKLDSNIQLDSNTKLESMNVQTEPVVCIQPSISTLSINDLPPTKEISCCTRFSGIIYALTSSLLFTCAAFSLKRLGVSLVDTLLLRIVLQTIITFVFASTKHYSLLPGTGKQIFLQMVCCAAGSGSFIVYFIALNYAELSDVTTLCYTRVIWTVIFSIFVYRERPALSLLIALPITLLGVVFVTQPSLIFSSTVSSNNSFRIIGLILAIISSVSSATNVLSFKQLVSTSKEMKSSVINFQYCSAVLVLLIIYQCYQKFVCHVGLSWEFVFSWKYILGSVICLVMMVCNILTQKAIKREHPAIFTLLGSADIIFALVLQNLFTNKRSNLFALLGSTLVILSVLIIGVSKMRTDRQIQKKTKLLEEQLLSKDCEEKC